MKFDCSITKAFRPKPMVIDFIWRKNRRDSQHFGPRPLKSWHPWSNETSLKEPSSSYKSPDLLIRVAMETSETCSNQGTSSKEGIHQRGNDFHASERSHMVIRTLIHPCRLCNWWRKNPNSQHAVLKSFRATLLSCDWPSFMVAPPTRLTSSEI